MYSLTMKGTFSSSYVNDWRVDLIQYHKVPVNLTLALKYPPNCKYKMP